jgi:hypothetical protein
MFKASIILLLAILCFAQQESWTFKGYLQRKKLCWKRPSIDWRWDHHIYFGVIRNSDTTWYEFRNAKWTSNCVKVNDWFSHRPIIKIVLNKSF